MKTIETSKCKVCGSESEKSTICINLWFSDADYPMYQCSNKNCPWHVEPHIYYTAYDTFKANGFVEQCNYIDKLVDTYSGCKYTNSKEFAIKTWNFIHEKKVEESSCNKEKVCYTKKTIEHNSIEDIEF